MDEIYEKAVNSIKTNEYLTEREKKFMLRGARSTHGNPKFLKLITDVLYDPDIQSNIPDDSKEDYRNMYLGAYMVQRGSNDT